MASAVPSRLSRGDPPSLGGCGGTSTRHCTKENGTIPKTLEYGLRILAGLGMTAAMWRLGGAYFGVSTHPSNPGGAFTTVAWVAFISLGWFLILGWPLLQAFGERVGNLFWPSDRQFRIRPEYSIAEARFHQGRYAEALAAFRADIERFPGEVYPHLRIAEIQIDKLGEVDAALDEVRIALGKAQGAEAFALVADQLADLLVRHRQDRAGALALMREIQERFPDTKQAKAAAQRADRLAPE